MQIKSSTLSAVVLAASAMAQNSVTTAVQQLPSCSYKCLQESAGGVGCLLNDIKCWCANGKGEKIISGLGLCTVLAADCSSAQKNALNSQVNNVCVAANSSSATSSDITAADAILASGSSNSNTSSSSSNSSSSGAAMGARPTSLVGSVTGAAALVAALAIWY